MICEYSNAVQPHPLLSDHLFCGLKPCKKIPQNKNGACPLWTDSINVKLDLVVGVLVGSPTRLLAQSLILCNQRLVSVSHTIFKLVSVSYEVLSSYVSLGV